MGYKFFSQSAAVALKSNIFVKNINYICLHFIFKININMPYKWKDINSSKINFEVKRNTLFCTIFHSFKINFDSTVPFNPHRNQAKWSRLSCPFFREENWASRQVSDVPMSANLSSGRVEAKTQVFCPQVQHSSCVRYIFQNPVKILLKNGYYPSRNKDTTLIPINLWIFENKAVQVYWEERDYVLKYCL